MDTHLKTKLKGSEADFMNYLIHYNVLYQKEGIQDYSDEIKESIETYRKDTDTIRSFLNVALTKSTSPDAKILTKQLLEYHNKWAGIDMTPQAFVKRLKANDVQIKQLRIDRVQGMCVTGYIFKPGFVDTINGNQCDSDDDGD
jgi:phage/plasmid-associated DNA primase